MNIDTREALTGVCGALLASSHLRSSARDILGLGSTPLQASSLQDFLGMQLISHSARNHLYRAPSDNRHPRLGPSHLGVTACCSQSTRHLTQHPLARAPPQQQKTGRPRGIGTYQLAPSTRYLRSICLYSSGEKSAVLVMAEEDDGEAERAVCYGTFLPP